MGNGPSDRKIRSQSGRTTVGIVGMSNDGSMPRISSDTMLPSALSKSHHPSSSLSSTRNQTYDRPLSSSYHGGGTARRHPSSAPEGAAAKRKYKFPEPVIDHNERYSPDVPPDFGRDSSHRSQLRHPSSAPDGIRPRESLTEELLQSAQAYPDETFQSHIKSILSMAGEFTSPYYKRRLNDPVGDPHNNRARESLKAALDLNSNNKRERKKGRRHRQGQSQDSQRLSPPPQKWERDYWKTGEYNYVRRHSASQQNSSQPPLSVQASSSTEENGVVIPGRGAVAETCEEVSSVTGGSFAFAFPRNTSQRSVLTSVEIPSLDQQQQQQQAQQQQQHTNLPQPNLLGLARMDEEDEDFYMEEELERERRRRRNKKSSSKKNAVDDPKLLSSSKRSSSKNSAASTDIDVGMVPAGAAGIPLEAQNLHAFYDAGSLEQQKQQKLQKRAPTPNRRRQPPDESPRGITDLLGGSRHSKSRRERGGASGHDRGGGGMDGDGDDDEDRKRQA